MLIFFDWLNMYLTQALWFATMYIQKILTSEICMFCVCLQEHEGAEIWIGLHLDFGTDWNQNFQISDIHCIINSILQKFKQSAPQGKYHPGYAAGRSFCDKKEISFLQ